MAFQKWQAPDKIAKQRPAVIIKKDSILIRPDATLPEAFKTAPYAYLAYDDETHRVGVEPAHHKDSHTFSMRSSTRGLSIAAGRFLNDFGLHTPQAEVANGQLDMDGNMAVFELKVSNGKASANGSAGSSERPRRRRRTKAEMEAARAAAAG